MLEITASHHASRYECLLVTFHAIAITILPLSFNITIVSHVNVINNNGHSMPYRRCYATLAAIIMLRLSSLACRQPLHYAIIAAGIITGYTISLLPPLLMLRRQPY